MENRSGKAANAISLLSSWSANQLQFLSEKVDQETRSVLLDILRDCHSGEQYLQQMTTKQPFYRQQIAQQTVAQSMVSGQLVAQLLQLLIRISGARTILELGTLTGYSALAMAEVLPDDGRLITCDRIAQANFNMVPWGAKIEFRLGLIGDTLEQLIAEKWQFDFVFLDADKRNYSNYFRTIIDHNLLRSGGILCADNTLFRGEVWQSKPSAIPLAIDEFNRLVAQDDRVEQILLPLRDGLTILYRH